MISITALKIFISVVAVSLFTVSKFSLKKDKPVLYVENSTGFAVVELFTSEGCSSCPAADDAVAAAAKDYPQNVFVLGFHVDYWNRLGWKDEFSSGAYTDRQGEYAAAFSLNSIYTPQVVVNGKTEFVGSDRNKLDRAIKNELNNDAPFTVQLSASALNNAAVSVEYTTNAGDKNNLNIALVQLQAVTNVRKGENSGRTLNHINIVRDFKTVDLAKGKTGNISFAIPKGLTPNQVKIIAFTQNKTNYLVTGAASSPVP
jgi:hypothetical protein